ncbi:DUF4126 family protein [Mucilaginibacter litoreus]|uniref:DUF4126 family protein n=1 Tax=Mucilaginibacter litoreus TaxID=1048221 RepID=A0ABW3ATH0_9SPHI
MSLSTNKTYGRAAALGLVAGMRSMYAPAVLTHIYSRNTTEQLKNSPLQWLQTIPASKVFKVLAVAELVGDKMPSAPNRTAAPGLIGRIIAGGLCGAAVFKGENKNALIGGLIGGAMATASTFGCFMLRRQVVKNSRLPDPVIGACEDILTIAAGVTIVSKL